MEVWDGPEVSADPLRFPGYAHKLAGLDGEAVTTGRTEHYAFAAGRFECLGGSMGAVVGERVVRAFRRATDLGLPMVLTTASGGARMQEGMVSLAQMARTVSAGRRHAAAGLLQLAVLRGPTTGGVYASFASLADVRAGERGATIGFAGPRVVQDITGERLPSGSHTAEAAFAEGRVDALVDPRPEAQSAWVAAALGLADLAPPPPARRPPETRSPVSDAWAEVVTARDPSRPGGLDWLGLVCTSLVELRGQDQALRAGLATIGGVRVVALASDRHVGTGRLTPAAYRLAQRAVQLADRLGLPVVSLVDTPGADPGPASEAAGVAGEIARTFAAFAELRSPSVAICVGEGGSGGALALAHTDRLLLLEHAVFSVIAPEGAASILHRDGRRAAGVAGSLRLRSTDLADLGLVDDVIAEGPNLADRVTQAIVDGLAAATPGDRDRRLDAATSRALRRNAD